MSWLTSAARAAFGQKLLVGFLRLLVAALAGVALGESVDVVEQDEPLPATEFCA